jgi:signal transduction histidine kinase/HPt (histidine-containing phosphotransfer) domain-containing protein/BarA-like signal transduction histidine kinase
MTIQEIKVLLIEANPSDVRLLCETATVAGTINLETVDCFADGIERLNRGGIDLILLDPALPDSHGCDTIERVHEKAPGTPIIVLSYFDDRELIQRAVQKGAEDLLIKGAFSAEVLARSIRYALDRSKARAQLTQARDSAIESARMRAQFLANMSHEIRTPLNGVIGMTRLLIETDLSGQQREMLEIARQSSDSLLRTVNDILDFSKISVGKVVLDETDFDLGGAVESVIAMFAEQSQRKGVELASYIEGDVPVMLRGDPCRLCQVLTNLIGNAVKFTPNGEVTVRVGLMVENGGAVTLRCTVKDTGIGIALDGQRHLFQAFTQATHATARQYGGTGLGLAIAAQLVELMGGNIGVQSEPGGGSTFWFTADFRKQTASAADQPSQRLAGTRVLVIEQNTVAAHIICEHMRVWGIDCEIVATAADAIKALHRAAARSEPYEIAVVEMQLAGMDGLALGRTIKADRALANVRLIGTYTLGARPDDAQLKAAGIRALLAKPIKQSRLFNTLNVMLAVGAAAAEERPSTDRPRPLRELTSRLSEAVRARTTVLLVEDNFVNQQVQRRLLEHMGYKAECVTDGRQALDVLARHKVDIILMDCQMPVMDGYTATREIRRREGNQRHTTIIGVTAHALSGDREECLLAGMDDYISKPVVPDDLAAVLDKWVAPRDPAARPALPASPTSSDRDRGAGKVVLDGRVLSVLNGHGGPNQPDFLAGLLAEFVDDLSGRVQTIRAGLANRDCRAVHEAAHALKSSCGQLGAWRMQELCQRLELSPDGALVKDGGTMVGEVELEASYLREAVQSEQMRIRRSA